MGEDKNPCDVDDLMCQMRVLGHLEGIQNLLGSDNFKNSFPELEGLGDKVSERIKSSEENIRVSFQRCGLPITVENTNVEIESQPDILPVQEE
jgi:hypothetical protein